MKLEEERDFLLRSLRDLEAEREAGDIDDGDYAGLRDDYTARAAAALRAIDARDATPRADPSSDRRRTPRAVAMIVVGVLGFAILSGALVARSAGERVAGRPATGALPPTAPPDDLTRARQLFSERKYLDALKLYDKVLKDEPRNVEALAYRGWLLFQTSTGLSSAMRDRFTDRALESLDRAVVVDPRFPDAHFFRGWVLHHGKVDAAGAVPEYRAFIATDPPAEFRQRVEQELNLALCDLGRAPPGITCAPAAPGP